MPDRLDYELRAIEADRHAETTLSVSMAHCWRDIASGYRLLAEFIAHEQAAQRERREPAEPPDRAL